MLKISPRFLLSPRFLALPTLALVLIVALSQTSGLKSSATEMAAPKVYRAVNCSAPEKAAAAECALAGSTGTIVR